SGDWPDGGARRGCYSGQQPLATDTDVRVPWLAPPAIGGDKRPTAVSHPRPSEPQPFQVEELVPLAYLAVLRILYLKPSREFVAEVRSDLHRTSLSPDHDDSSQSKAASRRRVGQ